TGLLVPIKDPNANADALNRLLDDMHDKKKLYRKLSRNGRKQAYEDRYKWAIIASDTVEVYREAMAAPPITGDIRPVVVPNNGNVDEVVRVHMRNGYAEDSIEGYEGWMLQHGEGSFEPAPEGGVPPTGFDEFGAYWDIPLEARAKDGRDVQRSVELHYTI